MAMAAIQTRLGSAARAICVVMLESPPIFAHHARIGRAAKIHQ
jgi:hypothetical protein